MPFRDRLADHQVQLLALAKNAEDILNRPRSVDLFSELASLRGIMFETLGAYQGFVHREVYEEAKRIGKSELLTRAEALKAACIELSFEYQKFAMRWAHRSAFENWPEYRLSALRIISVVREHVRNCPWSTPLSCAGAR